jgi:hypothetical protein
MEEQKMQQQILNAKPAFTDEELLALCGEEEKPQKTPRGAKPPPQPTTTGKKKKNKK